MIDLRKLRAWAIGRRDCIIDDIVASDGEESYELLLLRHNLIRNLIGIIDKEGTDSSKLDEVKELYMSAQNKDALSDFLVAPSKNEEDKIFKVRILAASTKESLRIGQYIEVMGGFK